MKEEEFIKKYPKKRRKIEITLYWLVNDKGNVIIDEEGVEDEFWEKLENIKELLNQDKLQQIVAEKVSKIKEEKK